MQMKTNFHVKGRATGLALKKRPKVIRKWSIVYSFLIPIIPLVIDGSKFFALNPLVNNLFLNARNQMKAPQF